MKQNESVYAVRRHCGFCGEWKNTLENRCPDCNRLLKNKPRYGKKGIKYID